MYNPCSPLIVYACVCMCMKERDTERDRETERGKERERLNCMCKNMYKLTPVSVMTGKKKMNSGPLQLPFPLSRVVFPPGATQPLHTFCMSLLNVVLDRYFPNASYAVVPPSVSISHSVFIMAVVLLMPCVHFFLCLHTHSQSGSSMTVGVLSSSFISVFPRPRSLPAWNITDV